MPIPCGSKRNSLTKVLFNQIPLCKKSLHKMFWDSFCPQTLCQYLEFDIDLIHNSMITKQNLTWRETVIVSDTWKPVLLQGVRLTLSMMESLIVYFVLLYRFEALVEREWVQSGHPFASRCAKSAYAGSKHKHTGPVFLLFLDCVGQVSVYNHNPSN